MLPAYQAVYKKGLAINTPSNGLNFDGLNDRVIFTNDAKFKISVGSIEGWIKTGNAGSGHCGAFGKTFAYFLYLYNNELIVYDWSGGGNRSTGITLNDNTWHHIAMSFNSGVNNGTLIYIDGVLKLTTTITVLNQVHPFTIGSSVDPYGQFFTGSIDDVRVWNVIRTQTEIQENMNNELIGTEANLVAYYTFNQGIVGGNNTSMITVSDKTANALNGTLTNLSLSGATSNFVVGKVQSAIISDGLVLQLDASNAASYPGSGTTWTDLSGNGNHGTLISGVTYRSNNGGTMVFDGTLNNRVQTNFAPTFLDFTVCVWYKDNGSPQYGRLIDKDYVSGFQIQRNNTTTSSWGGGIKNTSPPHGIYLTLTDGQWHFLTFSRSGTTHTIYGDGVTNKVSNTVSSAALSTAKISIGSWTGGNLSAPWNNQVFKGSVPQVLIYNRALSEVEIMRIFNATKAKFGL
jgi:hypothetical protein